jgi:hypothetical protein
MHELGKGLILLGLVLVVIGAVLLFGPKVPSLGKLPGDIVIKRENFTCYVPLATSIILSLIISLLLYLLSRFR